MMSGINAATSVLLRIVGGPVARDRVRTSALVDPTKVQLHVYQDIDEVIPTYVPGKRRAGKGAAEVEAATDA
jgi:hypothetical protein